MVGFEGRVILGNNLTHSIRPQEVQGCMRCPCFGHLVHRVENSLHEVAICSPGCDLPVYSGDFIEGVARVLQMNPLNPQNSQDLEDCPDSEYPQDPEITSSPTIEVQGYSFSRDCPLLPELIQMQDLAQEIEMTDPRNCHAPMQFMH